MSLSLILVRAGLVVAALPVSVMGLTLEPTAGRSRKQALSD
ncbi:MAG: hypothetical protein AB7D33_06920 [Sphingobium sp.]